MSEQIPAVKAESPPALPSCKRMKTESVLDRIAAQRRKDVETARSKVPLDTLEKRLSETTLSEPLDLKSRLQATPGVGMALMAEIKRASPSKGVIAADIDVVGQALRYARGGASAISVLTEPTWFKGTLEDMASVRSALDAEFGGEALRPAVLRKDFVVDEYQLYEARVFGADTVLLIVAILEDEELRSLLSKARLLGMEPLVEVNSKDEMERALKAGAAVVGVNNRNLHNFTVDLGTTTDVLSVTPDSVLLVALSGISTRSDVARYETAGVKGVLVGEALMRARDPARFIRYLLSDDAQREVVVKICGIKRPEDAVAAARAGADLLGIIFAASTRQVTPAAAREIVQAVHKEFRSSKAREQDSHLKALGKNGTVDVPDVCEWFSGCASSIEKELHQSRPLIVGVFSNQPEAFVREAAIESGIDLIQLHGSEDPVMCANLPVPCVKAVHVEACDTGEMVRARLVSGAYAVVLLDTKVRGAQTGGKGVKFDWDVARCVGKEVPIMMAGGLTPENVATAVSQAAPWGVDVSSGVEVDGVKDVGKMEAFVRAAKNAEIH